MSKSLFLVGLLVACAAAPSRPRTKTNAPAVSFKIIELPAASAAPARLAFACNPERVALPNRYDGLAHTKITKRICPEPYPLNKARKDKFSRDGCSERSLEGDLGSWAVRVTLGSNPGDKATWQVVYLTQPGQLLESPIGEGLTLLDYPRNPTNPVDVPQAVALFDFDEDGRSELITQARHGSLDKSFNLLQVWTAKGTSVTPFGDTASRRLIEIADSNQDQRPDFFMDPYGLPFAGDFAFLGPKTSWATAVELGKDGQVLDSGLVTEGQALARCPGAAGLRETLLRTRGPCVPQYLHCAKLWGAPQREVEAALDAYCEAERYDDTAHCHQFRAVWLRMYETSLPLSLEKPTGKKP